MLSQRSKLILELAARKENDDVYDKAIQDTNASKLVKENVSSCTSVTRAMDDSSPAPSLNALESNERLALENIIAEACKDEVSKREFQDLAALSQGEPSNVEEGSFKRTEMIDEEPFDDSDADPDYLEESESDDTEIPKKRLRISGDKRKTVKKKSGQSTKDDQASNRNTKPKDEESVKKQKYIELIKKKPGRKAEKNESRTIREERKKNRNLGLQYTTKKGKKIEERKCQELLDCRLKCKERIHEEKRQQIFKEYWAQGNFNKRLHFLARLIATEEKKTEKRKLEHKKHKNREVSHKYFLPIDGQLINVCQKCLLKTLDETKRFITDVAKNKSSSVSGIPHDDFRGLAPPINKTPEADLQLVREHILSIPSYESHYCRKDSSRQYLPHYYTLTRMYDEYKKWLPQQTNSVSKFKYQEIFHSMGIKIKNPSKDTCATCDKFHMLLKITKDISKRQEIQVQLDVHQKEASDAYEAKRMDKNAALESSTKKIYTFDLQQCLPTPDLQTSIAFYKRQLWTFNLTLHDCSSNQAICFMWHEGVAGRGANQIASCLYKHLLQISPEINEITFYSDTCAGQNKNSFLPAMYMMILKDNPNLSYINHKFLTPGHTHMECDSDHSIIEKKKKRYPCPIEHPRDWINLVRLCGNKRPFLVTEMSTRNFFEFSSLYKTILQQKKINDSGEKVIWKKIRWLRLSQKPGILEYKTNLNKDEPFMTVNFLRKGKTWPKNVKIPLSYQGPNRINVEKKKNLMELLPYISETFHDFYKNLKTKEDVPNTLPDLDDDSDGDNKEVDIC